MKNLNVVELNAQELKNVEGGIHPALLFAIEYLIVETVGNPKASYNAFKAGYSSHN
ncbi:class IIb bacteriocin, lactobin A/cerein 7B family [Flavobacterium davisii]|uniref:class IIb bacteriocin, lactobin A/cerein 7B family n=1 Tax=Flavobacterium davisii TaxID=2906077 RepID=UPI0035D0F93D